MPDNKSIFISYSSKDIKFVEDIIIMLDNAELKYWKAPEMIPAGSNYAKEIPNAISQCSIFLIIISEESQKSIWVEKELDCAINNRKVIVPVNINVEKLNDVFSFYLNNIQTIYYFDNNSKALDVLKNRLLELINVTRENPAYKSNNLQTRHRKISRGSCLVENVQPTFCKYCEGNLKYITRGIYKCVRCGAENYDYFHIIRNYLNTVGPMSITAIEHETGIPRRTIEYFLEHEMLEIPKGSENQLFCKVCGTAIRTGTLCEKCKQRSHYNLR